MSTILELQPDQKSFLRSFLPTLDRANTTHTLERPYVTLTYACSLDGLISLSPGVRTTLSGPETKSMTHYLRLHHDAILVGAGTAVADNPSLNCRYPGATFESQPQPLIVDPNLRWTTTDAAVVQLAQAGRGKKPWVVCREARNANDDNVKLLAIEGEATLDWQSILAALKREGINSIMIEGGASILNTLLMQPDLVDSVIVTVAPTWLGHGGVHVSPAARQSGESRQNSATLTDTAWKQFGADAVLCGRLQHV